MENSSKTREEFLKAWENKAKDVYSDSLKLLRDGFHGLEVMAAKTMDLTRIKLANQKALAQIRNLFTELGQRIYDAVRTQTKGYIKVTPDIFSFSEQIQKLQCKIEENLNMLRTLTTTESKEKRKSVSIKNKTRSKKRRS